MTSLLACPRCSHPKAKTFSRPMAYRGVRSGRWMIVPGTNCECVDIFAPWNTGDDPEPLIARWNTEATEAAAALSTRRGHTVEQAADFLTSLREPRYARVP